MSARRLILGTAQFGLSYGISNDSGRVGRDEVAAILSLASAAGVAGLDTAAAYGDSEEVLGSMAASRPFAITTKTLPVRASTLSRADVGRVEEAFRRSLRLLNRPAVDALLVHDADDLLVDGGERLWESLERFRREGVAGRIGVSVYDGAQIAAVTAKYPIDVVQLPINALDQRLLADGSLEIGRAHV